MQLLCQIWIKVNNMAVGAWFKATDLRKTFFKNYLEGRLEAIYIHVRETRYKVTGFPKGMLTILFCLNVVQMDLHHLGILQNITMI